ncbi:MAG: hypothetical protein ACUVX9_10300 [Anaerolineae bacterium]
MVAVRPRAQTQTEGYWKRDFRVRAEDVEAIYDLILEDGRPWTLEQIAQEVMARHCRREAQAREPEAAVAYRPREHYEVGQQMYFPSMAYAVGRVVGVRPGQNPRYGPFSVIDVLMAGEEEPRHFAADFSPAHRLNELVEEAGALGEDELTPEELCARYGEPVKVAVAEALAANPEFVSHRGLWFLRGMLPEVHVGYLNLAEAVVDVAGHPLGTEEILQQVELPTDARPEAQVFSLDLALSGDGRFDNVGSEEKPRWFLFSMEPPAVANKPERLRPRALTVGGELLHRESLEIVREVGDELDELPGSQPPPVPESGRASFTLNYPHRLEGTFPLTRSVLALFPQEDYTRIPIHFTDGRSDNRWLGWVLPGEGYGWGLADWYRREEIPAGATVELLLTSDPYTVVVQCDMRSRRTEWVRAPRVENDRLTFEIRKRAYTCRFDRNLLLGEPGDAARLDQLLARYHAQRRNMLDVILDIFPELAKLGSQGAVSAKALYAATNVVWRTGCVPVLAELARQACFDPIGSGNWAYDETLRGVVYETAEEMEARPRSKRLDLIRDRVLPYGDSA